MTLRLKSSTSSLISSGVVKRSIWLRCDVVDLHLFADPPDDAAGGELGIDLHRRLVVDQIAVDHRLAIAVGEDGRAEDLRGVQGWRGGEADLHRVEVVEHAAVLGDVVVVAAELSSVSDISRSSK